MSLLYLLLLVLIALLLQRLSIAHCLDGLSYDMELSKQAVECDEEFEIRTGITNSKAFPVLFLKVTENIPTTLNVKLRDRSVKLIDRQLMGQSRQLSLEQVVYIMQKQRLRRKLCASVPERGRYLFRGASLQAGDLLGLEERSEYFPCLRELVALPKRLDTPDIDSAFGNYLGDVSVRRFILSDPILTVGFREYSGREPQRDISWPRSLRDGRLMVKQYDYTAELTCAVLLNIEGAEPAVIERCYSLARGACEVLEKRRVNYSFLTNACAASAAGIWSYIGSGLGQQHLATILEGMGRATYDSAFSFEKLMLSAVKQAERNCGYVLVSPCLDSSELALLHRLEAQTGQKVFLIYADVPEEVAVDEL